jgi:conjugal transfer ATP-binding protein TraC
MNRNEMKADNALCEELPYWDFIEGPNAHAVLLDGSLVTGMEVGLKDIECMDEGGINHLTQGLRGALNSISEGTSLQFVFGTGSDFSDVLAKHRSVRLNDAHTLVRSIAQGRDEGLELDQQEGRLYRARLRIYLRTPMVMPRKLGWFRRMEAFSRGAEGAYSETLEALHQNVDSLTSSLRTLGLGCRSLSRAEIVAHVYEFLNPRRAKIEPIPKVAATTEPDLDKSLVADEEWLATPSAREQLVFGDLIVGYDGFTLDSMAHRVITLKTLPEVTYAGQLASFLRMPFHYDLVLSLDVPPQAAEMSKLQQKRKMAHSMAVTQGGRASDLESESKLSSAEELIRELLNTGQRIYAVQMSLVLRAPATPEGSKRLNRNVREALGRFRSLQGAEGLEETVGAWKVAKGVFPAAPLTLVRARRMKTHNLADFLPIYGPREGDATPAVIFRNRLGGLVGYDPFDPGLPNYNCLVTGSSGAGKSFLNNCILLQELARGLRVFVIDIGGSYRKLTEALGGQYLDVGLSEQSRLNPFDLPDPTQEPTGQKIKSLLAAIECMVSEDGPGDRARLGRLERTLLERAIIELYAKCRAKGRVPILSDLAADLFKQSEPSMKGIAQMLYSWTGDRPYGRLLDGPGKLRTDGAICTFDLKGLSQYPDLQSVMILLLTDFILMQIDGDPAHRKRIILDEAWQLLKSPASANFMEYCVRTLRKTGSGITFITQGIEELVASPIGPAILNCTETKFVMLQRGNSDVLREALKLNTQEIALIQSIEQKKGEYSEGFMIEGDHRQVIRVAPGPIEYWLSTSDPQDNAYLDTLRGQGLQLVDAIKKAALLKPQGVASRGEHESV